MLDAVPHILVASQVGPEAKNKYYPYEIELPLKRLTADEKKACSNTMHVWMYKDWGNPDLAHGITFGPNLVVDKIAPDSRAATKSTLKVGQTIVSVNNHVVSSAEEALAIIEQSKGDKVHFRYKRIASASEGGGRASTVSQGLSQSIALLLRTLNLQRRQFCVCFFSLVVPILLIVFLAWYQVNVVNTAGARLKYLIRTIGKAGRDGCSNTTEQLQTLCAIKSDTLNGSGYAGVYPGCNFCELQFHDFAVPGLGSFNVCPWVNRFLPNANGDQCTSSYFPGGSDGEPGGKTDFSICVYGPGMTYTTESSMPAYCNCSSPTFQEVIDGTTYCKLDAQFNSIFVQDPEPTKVLRDFANSGFWFTFAVPAIWIPDRWKSYVGWRVPVIAPSTLAGGVGSLSGYIADNGYLGDFNHSVDNNMEVAAAIDAQVSASGLIAQLPVGYGYDEPRQPRNWRNRWDCRAAADTLTCCYTAKRDTLPPCIGTGTSCPGGCQLAWDIINAEPDELYVCKDCGEFEVWPPNGTFTREVAITCPRSAIAFDDSTYYLGYEILNGMTDGPGKYCHRSNCTASTCTQDPVTSEWRNTRCDSAIPAMTSACTTMKAAVSTACTAGTVWRYTYDPLLLGVMYQVFAGILGWTPPGVDTELGPRMRLAIQYAVTYALTQMNGTLFNLADTTQCVPPFCFNFDTANGGAVPASCAVGNTAFETVVAPLDYLYPCFTAYASAYNHSSAVGALCREAYSIKSVVYVGWEGADWDAVPECAPSALSGAYYVSCGSCEETSCPKLSHFVAPVYSKESSMDVVTEAVLRAQESIRDEVPVGSPTMPLMIDVETTSDGARTTSLDTASRELDKIFPSSALQFNQLDLNTLQADISIASFWGDSEDWPYVTAPTCWKGAGTFDIIKFQTGLQRERWLASGGMSSVMLNWISNAVLRAGLADPNMSITTGMRPFPYIVDVDTYVDESEQVKESLSLMVDLVVPLGTSLSIPILAATTVMEKEHRLRALMTMMGMRARWYWLCEWLYSSMFTLFLSLMLILVGAAGDVEFITRSIGTFSVLLLLWTQVVMALAVFTSALYNRLLTSYLGNFLTSTRREDGRGSLPSPACVCSE